MLVFYWSGGQQGWSVGPLLALVPVLIHFLPALLEAGGQVRKGRPCLLGTRFLGVAVPRLL